MDFKKAMKSLTLFCFLLLFNISFSQDVKTIDRCATDEYNQQLMEMFPEMKLQREALERKISKKILEQGREQVNRRIVYTIPVVVHVIHNGENVGVGANISDAQVLSQIKVLNEISVLLLPFT